MKKLLFQTAIAAAVLAPLGVAHAGLIDYAKISVGESDASVESLNFDSGLAYGASIGGDLGPVRLELGVDHLSGDFASVFEGEALDYHGTVFADLPVGERASVFAGVGADYIDAEASVYSSSISADGSGWHWAVGGAYRMSDSMIAEAQFRRIDADLDMPYGGSANLEVDEMTLGFRLAL